MATTITIPIDAHLTTLCIESFEVVERQIQVGPSTRIQRERVRRVREVAPGQSATSLAAAINTANLIWRPADIVFTLRSTDAPRLDAPGNTEEVSESGFFQLASRYPARAAVSALFVHTFASQDLGGQAAEALGVCIVAALGTPLTGKVLAHELGHLLGLPHRPTGGDNYLNLMYPALRADDRLTTTQINDARQSSLVQRVYQQGATP